MGLYPLGCSIVRFSPPSSFLVPLLCSLHYFRQWSPALVIILGNGPLLLSETSQTPPPPVNFDCSLRQWSPAPFIILGNGPLHPSLF